MGVRTAKMTSQTNPGTHKFNPQILKTHKNFLKNGGRSALYFIPLGVSFDRQSTGLIEITKTKTWILFHGHPWHTQWGEQISCTNGWEARWRVRPWALDNLSDSSDPDRRHRPQGLYNPAHHPGDDVRRAKHPARTVQSPACQGCSGPHPVPPDLPLSIHNGNQNHTSKKSAKLC